jgi:hypothetical protein
MARTRAVDAVRRYLDLLADEPIDHRIVRLMLLGAEAWGAPATIVADDTTWIYDIRSPHGRPDTPAVCHVQLSAFPEPPAAPVAPNTAPAASSASPGNGEAYEPKIGDRVAVAENHTYGPGVGTVISLHLGVHVRVDRPHTIDIMCEPGQLTLLSRPASPQEPEGDLRGRTQDPDPAS